MSRTEYKEIVATHEDGTVIILESTFDHESGRGATGVKVRPVFDDEYLESRFEEYIELDAYTISAVTGQDEPRLYEIVGVGRMFPRALENKTAWGTERTAELIGIIDKFEEII